MLQFSTFSSHSLLVSSRIIHLSFSSHSFPFGLRLETQHFSENFYAIDLSFLFIPT